jgi:RNA polymerase sigma factor (sigma-70 family)
MGRDNGDILLASGQTVSLREIQRIASLLLPDRPELAEEAGQEAALKISLYRNSIDNLDAFVFTVVKNEVNDILRKEGIQRGLRQKLDDETSSFLIKAYRNAGRVFQAATFVLELLQKISYRLSDRQRVILLLVYMGYSVTEISETLKIKRPTIYKELEKIKKIIDDLDPPDPPPTPKGGGGGSGGGGGGVVLPPVRAGPLSSGSKDDEQCVAARRNRETSESEEVPHEIRDNEGRSMLLHWYRSGGLEALLRDGTGRRAASSRSDDPRPWSGPPVAPEPVLRDAISSGRVRWHHQGNAGGLRKRPPAPPALNPGEDPGRAQLRCERLAQHDSDHLRASGETRGAQKGDLQTTPAVHHDEGDQGMGRALPERRDGTDAAANGATTTLQDSTVLLERIKSLLLQLPAFREAGLSPSPAAEVRNLEEVIALVLEVDDEGQPPR